MKASLFMSVLLALGPLAFAEEPVLSPATRTLPGATPVAELRYQADAVTNVAVAGEWDSWTTPVPLAKTGALWTLDVRPLKLAEGRYEYKFVTNTVYEAGENRVFHINAGGLLEQPPNLVESARIDAPSSVTVHLRPGVNPAGKIGFQLEGGPALSKIDLMAAEENSALMGYTMAGDSVVFRFEPAAYAEPVDPADTVRIAGNFNGWNPKDDGLVLIPVAGGGGVREFRTSLASLAGTGGKPILFKFTVNGTRWLAPPPGATNATTEGGDGATNLRLDPAAGSSAGFLLTAAAPLDLSRKHVLAISGLSARPLKVTLTPGDILDTLKSEKPMGVFLDKTNDLTTYRLFAPRATSVHLCLFDTPEFARGKTPLPPRERYPLRRDTDGAWEVTLAGLDRGAYYSYNVDGPGGDAEGFVATAQLGDPYARAAAHAQNNTLVIDPSETNRWFAGWTDSAWRPPPPEDVIVYETHVRNLTKHPTSGVPEDLRGTYEGVLASLGTGTGLDHIKALGATHVQFMPPAEFFNGTNLYDWGYATTYFFAPEASYGRDPLHGSQYYELKRMIDGLHQAGFGVVFDVVFNHVGNPNVFNAIDKKYYFRLKPDFSYSNWSGCGNDTRTEAPMMRRLIVENILYWMTEFKVDGFRFDLAELIDWGTLQEVEREARRLNPDVLLISEPWSFRGNHKHLLKGSTWSAWNDDFRYAGKAFMRGEGDRENFKKTLLGSMDIWTSRPLMAVNYLESHDDYALADEVSLREDHNGATPTPGMAAVHRLGAAALLTSLGKVMIAEGQEFMRSKRGVRNTYNKGDEYNALNWDDRKRPLAAQVMEYYRGLIALRQGDHGRAFRLHENPPPGYYRWIDPPNAKAVGYFVNEKREHPGAAFCVLLNSATEPVWFEAVFPPGKWVRVADGVAVHADLTQLRAPIEGGARLRVMVPARTSFVFLSP
ncbi:MAG: alpha-amylase family glycosyl hydrolase [Kiritimatiellia bacterium]